MAEAEITHPSEGSLEKASGLILSREFGDYAFNLRVKPEVLEGQRILNFGSGGSNIGKGLEKRGVKADVVELDLRFEPGRPWLDTLLRLIASRIEPKSELYQKLVNIRRQLGGVTGRDFVQGDGRALPLPERTFDTILAHYSTYLLPDPESKRAVFRELLRVGDTLHCGPIFKSDFEILQGLADEMGFEIVVCHPFPMAFRKEEFMIKKPENYSEYIEEHDPEQRIQQPKADAPKITRVKNVVLSADMKGSSFIVLRRKKLSP